MQCIVAKRLQAVPPLQMTWERNGAYTVLTDNGIQFRLPPRYADGPTARFSTDGAASACFCSVMSMSMPNHSTSSPLASRPARSSSATGPRDGGCGARSHYATPHCRLPFKCRRGEVFGMHGSGPADAEHFLSGLARELHPLRFRLDMKSRHSRALPIMVRRPNHPQSVT